MTLTPVSRGDRFENFARGLDPDEGLELSVVLIEIVHDGTLQFADALEDTASDALVSD